MIEEVTARLKLLVQRLELADLAAFLSPVFLDLVSERRSLIDLRFSPPELILEQR